MKVLLVNGSSHKNGETTTTLAIMEKILWEHKIETFWFQIGKEPVRGCIDCSACKETQRCVFTDDKCNELIQAILEADGVIIGSPVYFSGPNGALCALLDRAFYAASNYGYLFSGKPAASVVSCWRAGATASLDRLNKYFAFSEMPVVSSKYWNVMHNSKDQYGHETIERIGFNMAKMIVMIEKAKKLL